MNNKKKTTKKSSAKGSTKGSEILKQDIYNLFKDHLEESFSFRQIIKELSIRDARTKDIVKDLIFSLETKRKIERNTDGKWKWINDLSLSTSESNLIGIVDHVNPNFAFVTIASYDKDVKITTRDLNGAIDGDEVSIEILSDATQGERALGRVLDIRKRNREEFVGRLEITTRFAFVIPDSRNIHFDIFIYPDDIKQAKPNDKVLVKIVKWPDENNKNPVGKILQILGPAGENEAEIHSIMAEYGLPFKFPEKIEKLAQSINGDIASEEIKKRRDFRNITTFTIDPYDAKDFDDALSIKKLDGDLWEIGVHIADVSHYVNEGSPLDEEALDRATSVYLVDRTIPMLPERLSNDLCSLRPKEEKLTFSAVFILDSEAQVKDRWFGRTIIYSDRRFTYEEAQERLETKTGDYAEEINQLDFLAKKLKRARFKNGAVNFETVEVKFKLDEKGKPLEVIPKVRKDAHKLIEEFMLLANKEVAQFIFSKKSNSADNQPPTFIYRIHADPDPEKLENFARFAGRFGHKLNFDDSISQTLNQLMHTIEGAPEQNILESLAIRAMAKARYTTEPKGHFGLAFSHYTHFTSPIRRYPDVMAHRLLWHYLQKGKSADKEKYEKWSLHSSEREKRAADAERASIKYKQVEFMQSMLGEEFDGIVSGVTEWGIFVEIISTKCEGMIRLSELEGDYFEFDPKNYRIVGKRSGRSITLGDAMKVKVVKTDIDRRTIDLLPADQDGQSIENKSRRIKKEQRSNAQGRHSSSQKKGNKNKRRKR